MDQPRAQHYYFVYRVLPNIVTQLGKDFIDRFKNFENEDWFKIWDDFGQELEIDHRVSHDGLTAKYIQKEKYKGIAISLPDPQNVPEAYFIFIVLKRTRFADLNKINVPRYFTLELGIDPVIDKNRTVFCELIDDSHKNMGDGPEPKLDTFISFVEQIIL
jgi:hypothetical protein